jgi:thioredoxin 1
MADLLAYLLLGLLVLLVAMYGWAWLRARQSRGRVVSEAQGAGRRLYYFYSPHCGPCRAMTLVIDRLASRHDNVLKVDIGADTGRARAFGVAVTPTLMLVEEGRITRVILGGTSEKKLESLLL